MKISEAHVMALQFVERGTVDLRRISEPTRQKVIDLGMMEPPLVDVDADRVFITRAGRLALQERQDSDSTGE